MIDGFVLLHRQVVLQADRARVSEDTFHEIKRICRERVLPPVPLDIFRLTPSARVQAMDVTLHLERCLISLELEAAPWVDRLLLEIILLHLFKETHAKVQDAVPEAGRAVALIGSMIQERLTELLLALESAQRKRVFGLGKLWAISQTAWENEFLGASAAVRTIRAFHAIEQVTVRLPTIEEDLDQGIDLFVQVTPLPASGLRNPFHLAVSVKSVNRPERMKGEHLLDGVTVNANGSMDQQQRIIRGANNAGVRYNRRFIPVRILVGRPEDVNYELFLDDSEIVALERLIGQIEKALRTPRRSARSITA